jgi:archaellum component FlaC
MRGIENQMPVYERPLSGKPEATLQDVADEISTINGNISDIGVEVARIAESLKNLTNLVQKIADSVQP